MKRRNALKLIGIVGAGSVAALPLIAKENDNVLATKEIPHTSHMKAAEKIERAKSCVWTPNGKWDDAWNKLTKKNNIT